MAWLRTGEALKRMLLEITRLGLVASPLTQVVEVPMGRAALRAIRNGGAPPGKTRIAIIYNLSFIIQFLPLRPLISIDHDAGTGCR